MDELLGIGRLTDEEAARLRDVPAAAAHESFEMLKAIALGEIKRALGTSIGEEREPLFADAADLFDQDFPIAQYLVRKLITRFGLAVMLAEPKLIKTWIATEIAIAVATGTLVCGEFEAEAGRVAYFFCEDVDVQVRNRIRALLEGRGLDPRPPRDRLFVRPRGKFLDILKDEDLAWLIASCRKIGQLDLVVLDPLRDLHSGEEDKSDGMAPVMKRLRLLGELLGCTVLVLHHAVKSSDTSRKRRAGQRGRGSSAIHGSTDSGIYLEAAEGDGVSQFAVDVESELKGARSAGRFRVTMDVVDDAEGCAIKATWRVDRDAVKKSGKPAAADNDVTVIDFVLALAARGEHHSRTALRGHDERPLSERGMTASLDRLIEAKRLELRRGSVYVRGEP